MSKSDPKKGVACFYISGFLLQDLPHQIYTLSLAYTLTDTFDLTIHVAIMLLENFNVFFSFCTQVFSRLAQLIMINR